MPPPRTTAAAEAVAAAATAGCQDQEEEDDWGHFSCTELSEDEVDESENEDEEAEGEETNWRKSRPTNRFASSRYSTCGACAARYPLVAACSSVKNLSNAVCAAASMASFQNDQSSSTGDADGRAEAEDLRLNLPGRREALFPSNQRLDELASRKRRVRSEETHHKTPIEARVRKRRDDFCSETRGAKTARWDIERWHVLAPRILRRGDYLPDRDGVILSPAFRPRVATRFFKLAQSTKGVTISFSMGSIRVVSTGFERYAQYELVVNLDGRTGSAWRRYSAFRALVASVAAESAPRNIVRTLSAWADAQDAKRIFRCTHPAYLIQRYYHFEHVLREALFELADPSLILAFFEPDDDDDDDGDENDPLSALVALSEAPPSAPPSGASSPNGSEADARLRRQPKAPFFASFLGLASSGRPFASDILQSPQVKCH